MEVARHNGDYPTGSLTDRIGPGSGSDRVNRGGDWYYNAKFARSADRGRDGPDVRNPSPGFRPPSVQFGELKDLEAGEQLHRDTSVEIQNTSDKLCSSKRLIFPRNPRVTSGILCPQRILFGGLAVTRGGSERLGLQGCRPITFFHHTKSSGVPCRCIQSSQSALSKMYGKHYE